MLKTFFLGYFRHYLFLYVYLYHFIKDIWFLNKNLCLSAFQAVLFFNQFLTWQKSCFFICVSQKFLYIFKLFYFMQFFKNYFFKFQKFGTVFVLYQTSEDKSRSKVTLFRLILNNDFKKVWHGICTIPNVGRQE